MVTITVNGVRREIKAPDDTPLLYVLRNELELSGPQFGCGLRRYLMEPNTLTTRTAIAKDIEAALASWEPRIQLTDVTVTPGDEPELAWVSISYQRLSDLRQDNLVYPFYFQG